MEEVFFYVPRFAFSSSVSFSAQYILTCRVQSCKYFRDIINASEMFFLFAQILCFKEDKYTVFRY